MKLEQYTSLDDKETRFHKKENQTLYTRIVRKEDFDLWYDEHSKLEGVIYRGVNEAHYKNYTSAQRLYVIHELFNNDIDDLIYGQIQNLRSGNNHLIEKYCKALGIPCSDLFIMSMAQHHKGSVSPLLDFSTDLNTALFFMWKDAKFPKNGVGKEGGNDIENYVSLYYTTISGFAALPSIIGLTCDVKADLLKRDVDMEDEIIKGCSFEHLKRYSDPIFVPLAETIRTAQLVSCNLNMTAQDGCFVYHNRQIEPLEANLSCVDIHKSLLPYINKKCLITNGKEDAMLFPAMDNIATSSIDDTLAELREND